MSTMTISDIGIKRFCYCPRWFYINYVLGFNPKTPVKAKFIISDALQKAIVARNAGVFLDRCKDLARSEDMVEEDVAPDEMFARGELLAAEAIRWLSSVSNIKWQEQLVTYSSGKYDTLFEAYPKLVAEKNGQLTLFHFRIAYEASTPMDMLGYRLAAALQTKGLKNSGIEVSKNILVSFIVRIRKERNSSRAKTPIVEIKEDELLFDYDLYAQQLEHVAGAIQHFSGNNEFPRLGLIDGTCIWCPNGRVLKDRILCEYPDEVLKQFSETSLQRTSIEKWRDEF